MAERRSQPATTPLRWLVAGSLLLAAAGSAGAQSGMLDLRQVCDRFTPLTVRAVDTASWTALLSMPSRSEGIRGWLVELDLESGVSRLYPDWQKGEHFGGSIGPGPLLAAQRCGDRCVEIVRWDAGAWRSHGPPFAPPANATIHLTWDGAGSTWVVLHTPGEPGGTLQATAYRLRQGGWHEVGTLPIAAAGSPAAAPSPRDPTAIHSGSSRFGPGGGAPWVAALPAAGVAGPGRVVAVGETGAAYLARDGGLFLSVDGGASWSASRWTPWPGGAPPASLDTPEASPAGVLALAWFGGAERGIRLTEWSPGGGWQELAELGAGETLPGGSAGYSHIFRLAADWLLVAGCEVTPTGCGLRLRRVRRDGGSGSSVRPFTAAWLDRRSGG